MTNIVLESNNNTYHIEAEGHAEGSNTVCAAISAIIYTVLGYLENFEDGAQLIHSQIADGYALIEFEGGEVARAIFDLVCVGFLQMHKGRENFVAVEIKEK